MSEATIPSDEAAKPAPALTLTAGALIRQAREASGLHIAALAVSLKVPVKKIEALEADRLDALNDAVFVRALASSVCRTLRMDPAAVLDKLPQSATPVLQSELGINTPFQSSGHARGLTLGVPLGHPVTLAVLVLLLAAAGLGFLPELQQAIGWPWSESSRASPPPSPWATPADSPASRVTPAVPDTVTPQAVTTVVESVVIAPAAVAPTAPPASAGVAVAATVSAVDPPTDGNAILQFKAKAASWVEVTDAKGVVVFRKTLGAGESAAVTGTPPLQAVVGRTDAVQVQLRGRPFELASVSKDNVARFEVK
ncbi:MAG: helix-turn-helix domain-containing protein [Betaproteobacteria bacterium]